MLGWRAAIAVSIAVALAERGLNLSKLESRPRSGVPWEYQFYADFDGNSADPAVQDALDRGFSSVEADVWLVDGELRVAHDLEDTRAGVTLESLYLDPLDELVRQKGEGAA